MVLHVPSVNQSYSIRIIDFSSGSSAFGNGNIPAVLGHFPVSDVTHCPFNLGPWFFLGGVARHVLSPEYDVIVRRK